MGIQRMPELAASTESGPGGHATNLKQHVHCGHKVLETQVLIAVESELAGWHFVLGDLGWICGSGHFHCWGLGFHCAFFLSHGHHCLDVLSAFRSRLSFFGARSLGVGSGLCNCCCLGCLIPYCHLLSVPPKHEHHVLCSDRLWMQQHHVRLLLTQTANFQLRIYTGCLAVAISGPHLRRSLELPRIRPDLHAHTSDEQLLPILENGCLDQA
mmetsp:Transcript_7896/g.14706  ORF Transcript_7896/g.14706 Transcript_7896/m.14706 type:complete len:212 (+) Transcript_7896:635-1270(+)